LRASSVTLHIINISWPALGQPTEDRYVLALIPDLSSRHRHSRPAGGCRRAPARYVRSICSPRSSRAAQRRPCLGAEAIQGQPPLVEPTLRQQFLHVPVAQGEAEIKPDRVLSAAMPQPNDLSRSLVALDQNSTIIAVIEMSQSSWLVAGVRIGCAPKVRFASDSLLEGDGSEPSVPRDKDDRFHSTSPGPTPFGERATVRIPLAPPQNLPYRCVGATRRSHGKTRPPRRLVAANLISALTGSRREG
jgi:hypothetical protein